jgi:hypothetical protein
VEKVFWMHLATVVGCGGLGQHCQVTVEARTTASCLPRTASARPAAAKSYVQGAHCTQSRHRETRLESTPFDSCTLAIYSPQR